MKYPAANVFMTIDSYHGHYSMTMLEADVIMSGGEAGARDLVSDCSYCSVDGNAFGACSIDDLFRGTGAAGRRTVPRRADALLRMTSSLGEVFPREEPRRRSTAYEVLRTMTNPPVNPT